MAVVKIDPKGRLVIPKRVRKEVGLKEGGFAKVEARDGLVVIEPLKSVSEAYFGAFKVDSWPEDLDSFLVDAVKEYWLKKATST